MTFYIFAVPMLIASLYMILRLRALTRHDKVLFQFCEVRRETMSLIREHNFNLSKDDYIALRETLEVTSATIHDYNLCKVYVFNFRKFLAAIKRFDGLEEKVNQGKLLKNEILALHKHFGQVLVSSFFTFTPFLRSEIVFKALSGMLTTLAKVGGSHIRSRVKRAREVISWIEVERHESTA